jgi:HAD superfamily hydrolase (TIGR01509 family)
MIVDRINIDAIIFDMDGLMFDTEMVAFQAWHEAGLKFGYDFSIELFKQTIGLNIVKTGEIYKKTYGPDFPLDEIKSERFRIGEEYYLANGIPVKEGLFDLLNYLKEKKIKTALATSTDRKRAVKLLRLSGTEKYFNSVTCGDEVTHGKPDPEIFLTAAEKLYCRPGNCIVLEDSETGIIAASNAGMLPVMVPDMVEPSEDVSLKLFKKFGSLTEVKKYFQNNS